MLSNEVFKLLLRLEMDVNELKTQLYGAWLPEYMKYDEFGFIKQVEDQQESIKELKADVEMLKSLVRRLTLGNQGNQNN